MNNFSQSGMLKITFKILALVLGNLVAYAGGQEGATIRCFQNQSHLYHTAAGQQILGLVIEEEGTLEKLTFSLTNIRKISQVHLYKSESTSYFSPHNKAKEIFGNGLKAVKDLTFTGKEKLSPGKNYLWLVLDLKGAKTGDKYDALCPEVTISGKSYQPKNHSPEGQGVVAPSGQKILVYYRSKFVKWNPSVNIPETYKNITDLVYFAINSDTDGNLTGANKKFVENLKKVKKARGSNKVNIHLCNRLSTDDSFTKMARNPAARKKYVANVTSLMVEHGFSGLDIDWEYPTSQQQWDDFALLVAELKVAFFPHRFTVSSAGGTWKTLPPDLLSQLDFFNLMAYDHRGKHSTFDRLVSDVNHYIKKHKLPRYKMIVGLPFYSQETDKQRRWKSGKGYKWIVERHPDLSADTDTFMIGDRQHYFNGISTIRKKTKYIKKQQLGGCMIWSLGSDLPVTDKRSLLRAVNQEM